MWSEWRVEWDSFDVKLGDTKIDVKATGYVQAWHSHQPPPARPSFSGLRSRTWSPETGYAEEQSYNADIYVFAVETCADPKRYNPLDVAQWEFYVLGRAVLEERHQKSMALSTVRALAGHAVTYEGLAEAITMQARAD